MVRTYGFLTFLLQRYLGKQASFLLVNSNFAQDIFFILFIYIFTYLFIRLFTYLFMYLFIYLCMYLLINFSSLHKRSRTLGLSLLGY